MFSSHDFLAGSDSESDDGHRAQVKELNDYLSCHLCNGYLVDATVLGECYHCFCRSCILQHLTCKPNCPVPGCSTKVPVLVHKIDPSKFLKSDRTLQELVNKLVPNLTASEQERRAAFYKSQGLANPDDGPAHPKEEEKENLADKTGAGYKTDDQSEEDKGDVKKEYVDMVSLALVPVNEDSERQMSPRFLRLPIMAPISSLQKFVKYVLKDESKVVDFFYKNEILGKHHTLKFIILTRYSRVKSEPMVLHYQIGSHSSSSALRRAAVDLNSRLGPEKEKNPEPSNKPSNKKAGVQLIS